MIFATAAAELASADAQSDIDRELLENMGSGPLDVGPVDESDRELFTPQKTTKKADADNRKSGKQTPGAERPDDEIVRDLLKELRRVDQAQRAAAKKTTAENGPKQGNPLVDLARRMRAVEIRIAKADSGKATQDGQKQIMDQLDLMIEQMKKSCCGGGKPGEKQCQGGTCERKKVAQSKKPCKSNKPGKGSNPKESTASAKVRQPEPGGRRTDMEQIQTIMKRLWGELPKRDREQFLQYPVEQFLPEYEQMIEEYYKRLSREDE